MAGYGNKPGEDEPPEPLALPPAPGPTVLPSPLASVVSMVSKSSTISLRIYSAVSEMVLDGARVGTMTGIEIGRTVLEGVLLRAGRDVRHSKGETLTGKSIDLLHSSLSLTQLLLSTTFHLSSFTLTSITSLCQSTIQTVESIFGDTESSRAIAAIMQILKREFGDDGTQSKEIVNVREVIGGIAWFAIVQMRCRRREREALKWKPGRKPERILWDVIVLDGPDPSVTTTSSPNIDEAEAEGEVLSAGSGEDSDLDDILGTDDESDEESGGKKLRKLLLSRLPPSASISVTTSSTTTRTTTVEVTGTSPPDFQPPKNAVVLSEASHHGADSSSTSLIPGDETEDSLPRYKITYQTVSRKEKKRKMKRKGDTEDSIVIENVHHDDDDIKMKEAGRSDINVEEKMNGIKEWRDKLHPPHALPESNIPNRTAMASPDPMESALSPRPRSSDDEFNRPATGGGANAPNSKKTLAPVAALKSTQSSSTPNVLTKPKKDKPTSSGADTDKEKSKRPKTLRKVSNFLPVGGSTSIPKEKKKKTSIASPSKDTSTNMHPRQYIQGRKTPSASRESETTLTTSRSRSELMGVERSASRASNHGIEKDSVVSTRSQTSTTTRTNSGSVRGHYSMKTTHTQAQQGSEPSYPYGSNAYKSPTLSAPAVSHQSLSPQNHQPHQMHSEGSPALGIATMPSSPLMTYRDGRSDNYAPSIYTLRTSHSQTSLFRDFTSSSRADPRDYINRAGGLYPPAHPVANIAKFIRYASASYGQDFLRLLGIGNLHQRERFASTDSHHAEHLAFSYHTKTPVDTILLSSFTDGCVPAGEGMVPLVHFVCLDHDMKSVVVSCRGTLGLEDVLADLTCEYDDLTWRGKIYRVHKGMLNSCMALLHRSNMLRTLNIALQEFSDYGLVFCGHSLGGGVAALLSILLSEPSGHGFVTSNASADHPSRFSGQRVSIPTGRPVHCYSYGSPSCVDSPLRLATRRLITSVVHGADIVPSLSFGVLKDFQSVALAFKNDTNNVIEEIRRRVLVNLARRRTWLDEGDDDFLWVVLKTLRACMGAEKLVPPGEVIIVSAEQVLTREGSTGGTTGKDASGPQVAGGMRHATKVRAKLIQDVEGRFGEVRFSRGMFGDHNPRNYEVCLELLAKGVCGESKEGA